MSNKASTAIKQKSVTISVIKADIGGYVGHSASHPDVLDLARKLLAKAKKAGTIAAVGSLL